MWSGPNALPNVSQNKTSVTLQHLWRGDYIIKVCLLTNGFVIITVSLFTPPYIRIILFVRNLYTFCKCTHSFRTFLRTHSLVNNLENMRMCVLTFVRTISKISCVRTIDEYSSIVRTHDIKTIVRTQVFFAHVRTLQTYNTQTILEYVQWAANAVHWTDNKSYDITTTVS